MRETTAEKCAQAFVEHWVARYGVPLHMTSDQGPQFTSRLWSACAESLGVQLHRTSAYHPQANGMVERWHRSLKSSLRARLQGPDWVAQLPWTMLGLRAAVKSDLDASPADLVFRHSPALPGEFVRRGVVQLPDPFVVRGPFHHAAPPTTDLTRLRGATYVYLRVDAHRSPLERPYQGPFRVLQRRDKTFEVLIRGVPRNVSVDRLKPAFVPLPQDAAGDPPVVYTRSGRASRPPVRF